MRFISFTTFSFPLASLILSGSLMGNPTEPLKDTSTTSRYSLVAETQVSATLRQIQSRAGELRLEAELLHSYARGGGLSWQTHAAKLSEVRAHINAIGQHLQLLQDVQASSPPWQQLAIDRMTPSAVAIADKTSAALGMLNENRQHVASPVYADHVQMLYEQADQLKRSIDPFVALDRTERKIEALRSTIGVEEIEWQPL